MDPNCNPLEMTLPDFMKTKCCCWC